MRGRAARCNPPGVTSQSRSRYVIRPGPPPCLLDPVPDELSRTPVADADVACPECGARSWIAIERRAEPEHPFTRWRGVACAECGASQGWQAAGRTRPGRGPERVMRAEERAGVSWPGGLSERPTLDEVVRAAAFAVYAPPGSAVLRKHGGRVGKLDEVTLAGDLTVETGIRAQIIHGLPAEPTAPIARARERLAYLLIDFARLFAEGRSAAARDLHRGAALREARDAAERAPASSLAGTLAGTAVSFEVVQAGERWAACAHLGDHYVVVSGEVSLPGSIELVPYAPA